MEESRFRLVIPLLPFRAWFSYRSGLLARQQLGALVFPNHPETFALVEWLFFALPWFLSFGPSVLPFPGSRIMYAFYDSLLPFIAEIHVSGTTKKMSLWAVLLASCLLSSVILFSGQVHSRLRLLTSKYTGNQDYCTTRMDIANRGLLISNLAPPSLTTRREKVLYDTLI